MAPWCILCIILCSTSCHYDVYSAVRHATMMYTLHYTLHSVLVPWCILCIILCIPSCHHHECSVCILLPWWMQSKHVHSALISYSEPASLQDKCRVCKLCLILCLNLWSPPPLHIQYSARILECISIRKVYLTKVDPNTYLVSMIYSRCLMEPSSVLHRSILSKRTPWILTKSMTK